MLYKYLGLSINEYLDYQQIAELQSEAASRALSLIITKMIKNGGFPYNVYSTLYESCCASVCDYGGEVIGFQQFSSSLKLHLRAARAFLGCPVNTTSPGVLSEIMWLNPVHRNKVRMIRQYNRVLKMLPTRLTRVIVEWDKLVSPHIPRDTWTDEIQSIFHEHNVLTIFESGSSFTSKLFFDNLKHSMMKVQAIQLKSECEDKPKLRTFIKFKNFLNIPAYLTKTISFLQRRAIAQLRLGQLRLRIEQARTVRPILPVNERTCPVCFKLKSTLCPRPDTFQVEDEIYFLFKCPAYSDLRNNWFNLMNLPYNFHTLCDYEKISLVLNTPELIKPTANFILQAFDMRSKILNS